MLDAAAQLGRQRSRTAAARNQRVAQPGPPLHAGLAASFDERNEAVMISIEKVVRTCKALGVTCSICGQAPSVYPEITEKLVEWGVTSISVSPDMIDITRDIIARVEAKLGVK